MRNKITNSINRDPETWALEWLRQLSFMDNELFTRAFRERPDLAEHLIRGILSKPDLNVVKMNTQASLFAMNTKEVILDCLCTDSDGKIYNIEVQNDARMPLGRRARAYGSLIDASIFKKGQKYEELPERYIIFITREDFLKNGRQVTVLAMRDEEGKSEDEMTGVMEQIRNESLELGRTQIAENMVRLGFASEQIAQATGLSAEKVAEIAKDIKN